MGLNSKAKPGDRLRIRADDWNNFQDAARALRGQTNDRQVAGGGGPRATTTCLVKNNSGGAWARFDAVAIRAPLVLESDSLVEFKNALAFEGYTAEAADVSASPQRIAVLLEPVANGKIGLAQISGVVPCYVTLNTSGDRYASLTAAAVKLSSGTNSGNAEIVYAASGTGDKWCLVRLGGNIAGNDPDATNTVRGYVSLAAQVMGAGIKSFYDGIICGSGGGYSTFDTGVKLHVSSNMSCRNNIWFKGLTENTSGKWQGKLEVEDTASSIEFSLSAADDTAKLLSWIMDYASLGAPAVNGCFMLNSRSTNNYPIFGLSDGTTVKPGVTGTGGGGDTITGGLVTTLGSGPTTVDGGTW